jgi:hypothetical protein
MRSLLIGALATLALPGAALAASPKCTETLDGGWRCKEIDGHVTERRPVEGGGARTTSTDPSRWGTSDGHGRGITPPDSMIRNDPMLRRNAWGRVADPWESRAKEPPSKGGWSTPGPDERPR